MQAINDYVIVDKIKEEPKKVSGLILTDQTDEDNRYKKATIISVGNLVEIVTKGDVVLCESRRGPRLAYFGALLRIWS